MTAFNNSPLDVSTSFTVLPKNRYLVAVSAPTAWSRSPEGQSEQYGARYNMTVLEGDMKGKKATFNGNTDNEIGQAVMKSMLGACAGFYCRDGAGEEAFNNFIKENYQDPANDFKIDPSTKEAGKYYQDGKGSVIWIDVETNQAKDGSGKEFQKFTAFYPRNYTFAE